MITENENQKYVQFLTTQKYIQKKLRRGFGNREKDKDKGGCTKQNRSVVRGSNVIMSDFY